MRAVHVGPFRCVLAAAGGDAALRAALEAVVGMWLWEGLYGCSILAASLVQRRCVQKRSGGGFFGVDARPSTAKCEKKGFSDEENISDGFTDPSQLSQRRHPTENCVKTVLPSRRTAKQFSPGVDV